MAKTQTNFLADTFAASPKKGGGKAGKGRDNAAENYQPESAFNEAEYYDEKTDSAVKFESGAQNEEGGDLVKDPSDALDGRGFSDVGQDLPDRVVRADEDEAREPDRNAHAHATVDEPMGNTEDAEVKSASGVTEKPAADRQEASKRSDAAKKAAATKKTADKKADKK